MIIASALWGFAALAAVLTLIPGLDTALVLRSSVTRTKTYAFATALGIQAGIIVWGVVTALGATMLLAASPVAYRILTIAGSLYLIGMGAAMVRAGFRRTASAPDDVPAFEGGPLRGLWIGLLTNLLNPKIAVFYLATLPQFVPMGVSPLLMGVLLALVHVILGMVWLTIVIGGGRVIARTMRTPRFARWIDRIAGAVVIAFGVHLALGSLHGA